MSNYRVAYRYAKSILDLAIERGQLEAVYADMQYLQQLLKASRDFNGMLKSPVVAADKKQAAIEAIAGKNISELTLAFTRLLVTKGREAVLPDIVTSFVAQYKEKKGIHIVKLTTATPLSEPMKNAIVEQVKRTSNMQHIELEEKVDPDIIGGFVLQAGDKLIDASISYDLKTISRQFDNNDFVYKVR